jgi:ABC-type amino acid transport substrate-binding protein
MGGRIVMNTRILGPFPAVGLVLMGLLLSACTSSTSSPQSNNNGAASAGSTSSTVDDIKKAGVLRDCIDPEFPPDAYLKNGVVSGIQADLAQNLASSLGVKVQFVQTNFPGLIAGLQANKCEVAFGPTARAKRAQSVTFAKDYLIEVLGLAVGASENRSTIDDFNNPNVKICQIEGTADATAVQKFFPTAQVVALQDVNSCFLQLATKRVDAFIVDNVTGAGYAAQHPGTLKMILTGSGGLLVVPSGIAVRYNDLAFAAYINVWLKEYIDGGDYEKLYIKDIAPAPDIRTLEIERGSD